MNITETKLVKFHDTKLICITDNGVLMVAIKPICDAIGLHADSALNAIKKDEILGPEHGIYHVQVEENQSRKYITLPIQHVHGWLFSIQSAKVKGEAKEKLLLYKKECYEVLFSYFFGNMRTMIESNKKEINILNELNSLNDEEKILKNSIREKRKELDTLRQERVMGQLSMF